MKRFLIILAAAAIITGCCKDNKYDLCVYGGTSAGVIAAYSAAQLGMNVVIVEPGNHFGGMTAGGLGFTDIGNKQAVQGVAHQFYRKVGAHYGTLEQWIFEPHVAEDIFMDYLDHQNITILTGYRLESVMKSGKKISEVKLVSESGRKAIKADWFIDCTYEGDLMAGSGVSYHIGRESNSTYGETYNGVQLMKGHQFPEGIDPYKVPGNPESGLLWGISPASLAADGTADTLVQAYNYRICLTDSLENMIPITRPDNYDPSRYELLLRLMDAQPDRRELNHYFIWSRMPGRKTDINNRNGFSTDMIGMNHDYPEADYKRRKEIIQAHTDYTKGLLYFIGHDDRVPQELREQMLRWGYPKDEYIENGHWTPQLYVRESRRMIGEYVATQADCQGKVTVEDGIAMAAYQMDSHNCQRIVVEKDGRMMVKNEGNVEIGGGLPYPISYRSITPVRLECTNLLVPVCMSASHIAYGSIRMEPVFMVLGQVAAIAAYIASGQGLDAVQDVDYRQINSIMEKDPYLDGSLPEILIDDISGSVSYTDGWKRRNRSGGYGPSYLEIAECQDNEYAEYRATIRNGGEYDVYSYQHAGKGLAKTTVFEITSGDKVFSHRFNADDLNIAGQTSGAWHHIGTYQFSQETEAVIRIHGDNSAKPLHADAILMIRK